jgi:hypothetical protein
MLLWAEPPPAGDQNSTSGSTISSGSARAFGPFPHRGPVEFRVGTGLERQSGSTAQVRNRLQTGAGMAMSRVSIQLDPPWPSLRA